MPGKINPNPTNLEKARRAAGFTRKKLSELSGISINTLKCCEQRTNNINTAPAIKVIAVAEVLGVPVRSILNDESFTVNRIYKKTSSKK